MRSVLKFLGSVKLALILFILLASASALGTLIPQRRTPQEYRARYGASSNVVTGLRLDRLYGSPGYLALLVLFAANLSVCSLTRLSPKLKRTFGKDAGLDAASIGALKLRDAFIRKGERDATAAGIRRELEKRRYRVREMADEAGWLLRGRRRVLGLFGADIVHLGLLVILAGGIVSGLGKSSADVSLTVGESAPIPGGKASIRLDAFTTEYYPGGRVKDWTSAVTVFENGVPAAQRRIEVNHPLSWKGTVLYQSSYGWDWEKSEIGLRVRRTGDPAFLKRIVLEPGASAEAGDGTTVAALRFIPDLVIGAGGRAESRSAEPNNPAVFIEGGRDGRVVYSGWIFARFPDVAHIRPEGATDLVFELEKYSAPQFSVLQASRDPGVGLIWIGCSLLLGGLFLSFYWPPREVRISVEARDGGTVALATGGLASKGREDFEREFADLAAALRRVP
jgi:cytochrome c biogenesis protein